MQFLVNALIVSLYALRAVTGDEAESPQPLAMPVAAQAMGQSHDPSATRDRKTVPTRAAAASGVRQASLITQASEAQYVVHCRLINEEGKVVAAPKVIVLDGVKGTVASGTQCPLVTAVTSSEETAVPHIEVVQEGTSIDFIVIGQSEGKATIDATIELSKIGPVGTKGGRQTVQVDSQRKRVIDFVAFGETLAVPVGKGRIEMVVNPVRKP